MTISGAFGADRDISSEDRKVREQGLKYIMDCIKIAEFSGSPIFGGLCIRLLERPGSFQKIRKKGKGMIETFGAVSGEIAKAACIWRPLANSSDELAEKDWHFIKVCFK